MGTGTWISEAALWSNWIHVGSMTVQRTSRILTIKAEELIAIVVDCNTTANGAFLNEVKAYGRRFHFRVISAVPPIVSWPTDLHVPDTGFADLFTNRADLCLLKDRWKNGTLQISETQ